MTVIVHDTPEKIRYFRLAAAKSTLNLMIHGIKVRHVNVSSIKRALDAPKNIRTAKALLPWVEAELEKLKQSLKPNANG